MSEPHGVEASMLWANFKTSLIRKVAAQRAPGIILQVYDDLLSLLSVRLPQTSQSSHSKRCDRELTTASPNPELCDYKGVKRVQYKLVMMVHRCLQHQAPRYHANYCVPCLEVPGRQHLWSARRRQLSVPRVHCSTFQGRAFSVTEPTVWNSLSDELQD